MNVWFRKQVETSRHLTVLLTFLGALVLAAGISPVGGIR